jgi:hypothetical protein
MAAGDVPPHFALNPSLSFGYHYLLLLFAAELMRLGSMFPWTALDLARGLSLALPLVLADMWGYRLARSRFAAFLTAGMMAFAGGARWLLLLLPPQWMDRISGEITLIGSAASSAPNLAEAMISSWKIDGAGPMPFPFAFYSGVNQPYVMNYTGIAGSAIMIIFLLLLTADRWRHWSAMAITSALLAALAIANEILFLLIGMGLLVGTLAWRAFGRKQGATQSPGIWLAAMAGAAAIAMVQGGLLTEIALASVGQRAGASSYFNTTPGLVWPPAIVSAHLGSLSLANPAQLVAALLEIGPVVIITPLALAAGWRAVRRRKWFEASVLAGCLGVFIAAFVVFKGPLYTAAPRLMGGWFLVSAVYFVPLAWLWLRRRKDAWRIGVAATGLVSCLGGVVLFGTQLAAIQKPTYATFITPMDAKMSQEYWNELDPGAMVFDPVVFRAPTVLGRFTNSSPTWYSRSAQWQGLLAESEPIKIRSAGFAYVYLDSDYWEGLSPAQQAAFGDPCVDQIAQVDGIHGETDYTKDFRRLLDIRACH